MIRLLRPWQWVKNGFVFLPLFFSGGVKDGAAWIATIVAAVAFCLASSGVYCLNDVIDQKADRTHPRKQLRPVASGKVSSTTALIVMSVCILASFGVASLPSYVTFRAIPAEEAGMRSFQLCEIIAAYLLLNVAYCFWIKKIALIDVFTLALGFVLRIFAGGALCAIPLSPWIICLTYLLALFLAVGKRRDDVIMMESSGEVMRDSTRRYNRAFMDLTLGVICAVTVVCYVMYCVSPEVMERLGSKYVYVTAIFVLLGMVRYLQLALVDGRSGNPTEIVLSDGMLRFAIIGWVISFAIILY